MERLDLVFQNTQFLGTTHNFPNVHIGYLMACMAKLDFLGHALQPNGKQPVRMLAFLDQYVGPGKHKENKLILQMFRNTLMHTGELRFMQSADGQEVFTWRLYWSEALGGDRHYEISEVDPRHQEQILAVYRELHPGGGQPRTMCLHWRLASFVRELQAGAERYFADVQTSGPMQARLRKAYRDVAMQKSKA